MQCSLLLTLMLCVIRRGACDNCTLRQNFTLDWQQTWIQEADGWAFAAKTKLVRKMDATRMAAAVIRDWIGEQAERARVAQAVAKKEGRREKPRAPAAAGANVTFTVNATEVAATWTAAACAWGKAAKLMERIAKPADNGADGEATGIPGLSRSRWTAKLAEATAVAARATQEGAAAAKSERIESAWANATKEWEYVAKLPVVAGTGNQRLEY
eukprot:gnl/MRDRNA2_/MRDRNA2_76885_c0_seq2.p1 gnl/MRDRNA2_/MRDRNA2_76885_c0~~gnl/MRDRNA2_/MRDRNA2_76885_c0_seq2.p1  ORF type:complete len:213 (+),score=43.56 gnl/MRDRNA2_/MRDRNA2_76885_c0_seq2:98-736(+)